MRSIFPMCQKFESFKWIKTRFQLASWQNVPAFRMLAVQRWNEGKIWQFPFFNCVLWPDARFAQSYDYSLRSTAMPVESNAQKKWASNSLLTASTIYRIYFTKHLLIIIHAICQQHKKHRHSRPTLFTN